jgi:hypothetical protein
MEISRSAARIPALRIEKCKAIRISRQGRETAQRLGSRTVCVAHRVIRSPMAFRRPDKQEATVARPGDWNSFVKATRASKAHGIRVRANRVYRCPP